jgi:serine/threonine protein kinase/WD40 repeat protein
MNDPSDSFQLDEHLARLLAAYDQAIEGGDAQAQTIGVPRHAPLPGERAVTPFSATSPHVGSVGEVIPGPESNPGLPDDGHTPLPMPAAHGPHRVGRFELRRQLGKGGCGIVFLAYDPKLERELALKIPRPEMLLSPDARRRLIREALAAAEFDHPNLVPVYETGEIGPVCYIATAFCPGQTLGEWLDRQAFPVPVRQSARLVATVAEAVQHAHDRGVLHRDLKPNNVILQATKEDPIEQEPPPGSVQLRGDQYIPRVVDFGLAKLLERGGPSETTTRQILGTPKYMAPEQAQARHEDVGPTADVYALGVILYEMITGRAPYEGATDVEVLRQAIDGNLTQPRHLRSDVPRDLEAICLKAMDRSPARRYRTAIDLADDLRRFLDDKPTLARPLKWPGRAARWLRRNDQAVALVVVSTIASVLLAVGWWSMAQTRQLKSDRDSVLRDQAERTRTDQQRDYAKAVRSAFLAWRSGDTRSAAEYLDTAQRLAQMGGEATDFAHGYLTHLVAADRLMIVCPAGPVTSLAVSPDGRRLASGHADGTLAVWDRRRGDLLASVKGHDDAVTHLAFALGGTRLLSVGGMRQSVETGLGWSVGPAGQLSPAPAPHRLLGRNASSLAVSPAGDLAYLGTLHGELFKVHLSDGAAGRAELPERVPVTALAVTADGKAVLCGTGPGTVFRYSAALERRGERKHPGPVTALLPRGDGQWYLAASPLGINGAETDGWFRESRGRVDWLAALPGGGFATSDSPGRVVVNGTNEFATGDFGPVRRGVVSGDGRTLFTAGDDGVIRSWEFPTDLRDRGVSAVQPVTAVGVQPDGRWFDVASRGSVRLNFGARGEQPGPAGATFAALRVPREGGTTGVQFRGGAVVVGQLVGNQGVSERARFSLTDGARPVSAALTPDAAWLAVGDDRGRVFVWGTADGQRVAVIDCGHRRAVRRVSLASDGKTVAAPNAEGIGVWLVGEPSPIASVPADDQAAFDLFPLGDRLGTGGRGGVVRVWSVPGGREEATLYGHVGRVTGLGVSHDGRTLVSGGATGEVLIWDLRTGQELVGLRRHSGPVTVVEFSANGKLLVTAGRQLAVWEVVRE